MSAGIGNLTLVDMGFRYVEEIIGHLAAIMTAGLLVLVGIFQTFGTQKNRPTIHAQSSGGNLQ